MFFSSSEVFFVSALMILSVSSNGRNYHIKKNFCFSVILWEVYATIFRIPVCNIHRGNIPFTFAFLSDLPKKRALLSVVAASYFALSKN
jgi:hypothetical protein